MEEEVDFLNNTKTETNIKDQSLVEHVFSMKLAKVDAMKFSTQLDKSQENIKILKAKVSRVEKL
jgi:hypothetical protein